MQNLLHAVYDNSRKLYFFASFVFSHPVFDTLRTKQSAHCHLSGAMMKESVDAEKKRTIKDKGRQVIDCDRAT